jgi:hypothetical protein
LKFAAKELELKNQMEIALKREKEGIMKNFETAFDGLDASTKKYIKDKGVMEYIKGGILDKDFKDAAKYEADTNLSKKKAEYYAQKKVED